MSASLPIGTKQEAKPHVGAGPGADIERRLCRCGDGPLQRKNQRQAHYVFDGQVQQKLSEMRADKGRAKAAKAAQTSASAT